MFDSFSGGPGGLQNLLSRLGVKVGGISGWGLEKCHDTLRCVDVNTIGYTVRRKSSHSGRGE